jgi:adenosine kinase
MPIAVSGSIATDHLMHFPGKFRDSLLPDQLHRVSLSFLVDDLVVRRGGVAPNICFGMAKLGLHPVLIGAAGADFGEYENWLTSNGVDCSKVHLCADVQTARFVCTTDDEMNQIASFYAGAMARSREIDLEPIARAYGGLDLVVIAADDPEGMVKHSAQCRDLGLRFAADPSQQLARMDGPDVVSLITGANVLLTNDYELELLQSKTGWSKNKVQQAVGYRVTTLGSKGVEIEAADGSVLTVAALPEKSKVDPTGVGDAFRAGFLAGNAYGLPVERSAQLGSLMATLVLETIGTQEYSLDHDVARVRLADAYGEDAAADIALAVGW